MKKADNKATNEKPLTATEIAELEGGAAAGAEPAGESARTPGPPVLVDAGAGLVVGVTAIESDGDMSGLIAGVETGLVDGEGTGEATGVGDAAGVSPATGVGVATGVGAAATGAAAGGVAAALPEATVMDNF